MNNEDQPLLNKRAAKLADAIAAFGAAPCSTVSRLEHRRMSTPTIHPPSPLAEAPGSATDPTCRNCIHSWAKLRPRPEESGQWCYMFRTNEHVVWQKGWCGQKRVSPNAPGERPGATTKKETNAN